LKIHHCQQIDWKFCPDYGIFPEILQMVKWIAGARFDIKWWIALKTFEKVNIFLTFCYMFSQTADLNSKLSRDFANCRFRKLQISQITDFAKCRFRFVSFRFVNYSKPVQRGRVCSHFPVSTSSQWKFDFIFFRRDKKRRQTKYTDIMANLSFFGRQFSRAF
jgi:hypothetical protein